MPAKDIANEIISYTEAQALCSKTFGKIDLYRGMRIPDLSIQPDTIGKTSVSKKRIPRNSSLEYHIFLNNAFKNVFGVFARSESFFCTADKNEASGYGDLFQIWPSDDFKVYWSNTIKDLFRLSYNKDILQNEEYAPFMAIYCLIAENGELRSKELLEHYFQTWPSSEEFLERNYPGFMERYPENALATACGILCEYPNAIHNFVKNMYHKGSTLQDLQKAFASQNEIMICSDWYVWKLAPAKE